MGSGIPRWHAGAARGSGAHPSLNCVVGRRWALSWAFLLRRVVGRRCAVSKMFLLWHVGIRSVTAQSMKLEAMVVGLLTCPATLLVYI